MGGRGGAFGSCVVAVVVVVVVVVMVDGGGGGGGVWVFGAYASGWFKMVNVGNRRVTRRRGGSLRRGE